MEKHALGGLKGGRPRVWLRMKRLGGKPMYVLYANYLGIGDKTMQTIAVGETMERLLEDYLCLVRECTGEDIETMEELDIWLASRGK